MAAKANTIVVNFVNRAKNENHDVEIPLNISADALVLALNRAFALGIDEHDAANLYLQSENPIALIRGEETVDKFGLHRGTVLYYVNH